MLDILKNHPIIVDAIIVAAATLLSVIGSVIHAKKTAKETKSIIDIIFEVINSMETTEKALTPLKHVLGSVSDMKKDEVVTKIQNFCMTKNIKFDREKVSNLIEYFIDFSKKVNAKEDMNNG